MERIAGETMVLYSDLRERLEAFEAMRTVAYLPGEFRKGRLHHHFQTTLAEDGARFLPVLTPRRNEGWSRKGSSEIEGVCADEN